MYLFYISCKYIVATIKVPTLVFDRNEMSQKQKPGNIKETKCSVLTEQEQKFVLDPTQYLPSSPFHLRMRRDTISKMLYHLLNTR